MGFLSRAMRRWRPLVIRHPFLQGTNNNIRSYPAKSSRDRQVIHHNHLDVDCTRMQRASGNVSTLVTDTDGIQAMVASASPIFTHTRN